MKLWHVIVLILWIKLCLFLGRGIGPDLSTPDFGSPLPESADLLH